MAITDQIIRKATNAKTWMVGPANLFGPSSDRRKRVGKQVNRINADVDFYEISQGVSNQPAVCVDGGLGPADSVMLPAAAGDYEVILRGYLHRGRKVYLSAIQKVSLMTWSGKENEPVELLAREVLNKPDKIHRYGFTADGKSHYYISIERQGGVSSINYLLELEYDGTDAPAPVDCDPAELAAEAQKKSAAKSDQKAKAAAKKELEEKSKSYLQKLKDKLGSEEGA